MTKVEGEKIWWLLPLCFYPPWDFSSFGSIWHHDVQQTLLARPNNLASLSPSPNPGKLSDPARKAMQTRQLHLLYQVSRSWLVIGIFRGRGGGRCHNCHTLPLGFEDMEEKEGEGRGHGLFWLLEMIPPIPLQEDLIIIRKRKDFGESFKCFKYFSLLKSVLPDPKGLEFLLPPIFKVGQRATLSSFSDSSSKISPTKNVCKGEKMVKFPPPLSPPRPPSPPPVTPWK